MSSMTFTPAGPGSLVAFSAIVLAVLGSILAGILRAYRVAGAAPPRRAIGLLVGWLLLHAIAVGGGFLQRLPMNGLPFFFVPVLVIWLSLGLSSVGGTVAAGIPLVALVAFQGFRLPLELVLHSWSTQGTIPEVMTWSGRNWDIASGIAALVCAPFVSRARAAAWIANVLGIVLLLNVMRVAMLSAPTPFGWKVEPPLLIAFHLPYTFIGPVCVGGAIFGHVVLTRALLAKDRET